MIKWFCDICKQEIPTAHPKHIELITEGRNRELQGWGEPTSIVDLYAHPDCAKRLTEAIEEFVKQRIADA